MPIASILHPKGHAPTRPPRDDAALFTDLNLDSIVATLTQGKEEYDIAALYHEPLLRIADIEWRQEVARDVEDADVRRAIDAFAASMRDVRKTLGRANKMHYKLQAQRWAVEAARAYCAAIERLARDLTRSPVRSRGLTAFRDALSSYATSQDFAQLRDAADRIIQDLTKIRYSVLIHGLHVLVQRSQDEPDYSAHVEATFARFAQGAAREHTFTFPDHAEMNHVEAKILDGVAQLFPSEFAALAAYVDAHGDFQDELATRFDREVQFYVAYLDHAARLKERGLAFCYPTVTESKEVFDEDGFDLALAHKLASEDRPVVPNTFRLTGPERVIVVTGPNQGGKTTFARTFGQLQHLARLGLPVPGTRAQLHLCDEVLTHFERSERVENLRGKLQDDILRVHDILERATPQSVILLNEIFTSTTLQDAVTLSKRVAKRVIELDALCVWVTFLDELSTLGPSTVSMMSTVDPNDPATRTFKIVRAPANGLAYARSLARKYGLTREQIQERIRA